ncbi:MAG TPA: alpha/beta fold hydrolase [Candidatus Acidoferrales bacterium]|nr:alpha/beta fold hydrolase [Candidatus Acidoferrales bacterium]
MKRREAIVAALLLGVLRPCAAWAASSDLTLSTATGQIAGTLEMPETPVGPALLGAQGPVPVVLIIAGSGPTDRNGNNPMGVTGNTYRLLAEALAAHGIASVRYDKRGVGMSKAAMVSPLTFSIYVDDAVGWVRMLRADPRFSHVVLAGHSEGSLIALLAAAKTPVDGVISLEGAGRPIGDVLTSQIEAQGPSAAPLLGPLQNAITDLRAGRDPQDLPPALMPLFPPYLYAFLHEVLNIDPATAAAQAKAPLAIVQGEADMQVGVEDAKRLAAARPDATLSILPHMTHMLKDAADDTRAANLATYTDSSLPLDAAMVQGVVTFVQSLNH